MNWRIVVACWALLGFPSIANAERIKSGLPSGFVGTWTWGESEESCQMEEYRLYIEPFGTRDTSGEKCRIGQVESEETPRENFSYYPVWRVCGDDEEVSPERWHLHSETEIFIGPQGMSGGTGYIRCEN